MINMSEIQAKPFGNNNGTLSRSHKIRVDHSGEKFGRLTLLSRGESYIPPFSGGIKQRYYCSCDCGRYTAENPKLIVYEGMKRGLIKSCGCLRNEPHKFNTYEFFDDYVVGYATNTNTPFYVDIEDYELIKNYRWHQNSQGYIQTSKNNKQIKLHNLIMNNTPNKKSSLVDHINHDICDNRKINLRIVTASKNIMNTHIHKNNTSGVRGVVWHIRDEVWEAYISYQKKRIFLGRYHNFDDAVKARKEAEEKYFGEHSYDNSINSVKGVSK